MLTLEIPDFEQWNETKEKFEYRKGGTIQLVHTLRTISIWEGKYHKAFLKDQEKTNDEIIDYIKMMTVTEDVDPEIYYNLSETNYKDINTYLEDTQSATVLPGGRGGRSSETITADLIYYWMTVHNLPMAECQDWHLGRLLNVLGVCNFKSTPSKKRSQKDIMTDMAKLNKDRRAKLNSRG